MIEYVIVGVVCFAVGLVCGVALVLTVMVKGMRMVKSSFQPKT